MRIAISTSVIQRGKTGVAQYVFALLRALLAHAQQHEFKLLVLEEDLPLFEFAAHRMQVIPVAEKYRPAARNIYWHHRVLPGWLRRERIDVLHVPSYRRLIGGAPCATVATIHDLAPFHVPGKYDAARMFYGRVVVRYLARRQDAIIAISTNTAHDIETFFGVPVSRLNLIHNGIDHKRFAPGPAVDAAARWQLDRPFFLYISRLEHPAKNHVRLIEAFSQFKARTGSDWLLALGGSDWHGAEHIHAAAQRSAVANAIRFLGFVDDGSLPDLYRSAGALVYPSLFEGFGFPPLEAMACGCPVLCSTCGSLGEIVGDAADTIDPLNIEALRDGLTRLATDAGWRDRLRVAGFRNAQRFDWSDNAAKVLAVYDRAAAGRQ